jgi:hypothetical protein
MDEFILTDPEDDEDSKQICHINSRNSLYPASKPLIIDKHLDRALEDAHIHLFEEAIELWKIYGES